MEVSVIQTNDICKQVTDHDLEHVFKDGRGRAYCPKCGSDVSLAAYLYAAALRKEQEEK